MKDLSDEAVAVILYALQAYEYSVDGDRTDKFVETFYKLMFNFKKEYDDRNLIWKVFWKHEP